jgi:hypothetical protein
LTDSLRGVDVARRRPHLLAALRGRRVVSPVVRSATSRREIVAFAVPFATPDGRRVFTVAFDLDRTPLGAYLASALPLEQGRVVLSTSAVASWPTTGADPTRCPTDLATSTHDRSPARPGGSS